MDESIILLMLIPIICIFQMLIVNGWINFFFKEWIENTGKSDAFILLKAGWLLSTGLLYQFIRKSNGNSSFGLISLNGFTGQHAIHFSIANIPDNQVNGKGFKYLHGSSQWALVHVPIMASRLL